MITGEDVSKIVNNVVELNHELFYTKPGMDLKFEGLRTDFSKLQTVVETFAVQSKNNAGEIAADHHRISNTENWIKQAGDKIGLDYKPGPLGDTQL